jgi:hypothetical protein
MAIRARPGQFLLSPKPAPGRRGSRVRSATVKRDRLPLSRARQMGGAAVRSTPLTTSSAPSQKRISILASRLPGESRPLAPSLPTMYPYHQAAAMASSTSQRGRACLPGSYPFESLDAIRRSLYPSFRWHRARRVALPPCRAPSTGVRLTGRLLDRSRHRPFHHVGRAVGCGQLFSETRPFRDQTVDIFLDETLVAIDARSAWTCRPVA